MITLQIEIILIYLQYQTKTNKMINFKLTPDEVKHVVSTFLIEHAEELEVDIEDLAVSYYAGELYLESYDSVLSNPGTLIRKELERLQSPINIQLDKVETAIRKLKKVSDECDQVKYSFKSEYYMKGFTPLINGSYVSVMFFEDTDNKIDISISKLATPEQEKILAEKVFDHCISMVKWKSI